MAETVGPYARALGAATGDLDPQLQTYFPGVPRGAVGRGSGVFDVVGTPRRWLRIALWPVMRTLQRRGVVPAGWHTGITFEIENRVVRGRAVAVRTLHLPNGPWQMRDAVRLTASGALVDTIGSRPTVAATFAPRVESGGLALRSTRVAVGAGRLAVRLPRALSPVVTLSERAVPSGLQGVSLTIDAPFLGRIYEYAGTFRYVVEPASDSDSTEASPTEKSTP